MKILHCNEDTDYETKSHNFLLSFIGELVISPSCCLGLFFYAIIRADECIGSCENWMVAI